MHDATARLLYTSRQLDRMVHRGGRGTLNVPTTLMLAERDRIIDNAATRALVARLTGGGAVVETFDAAHVLEFEPDTTAYFEALARALQRGGRRPAPHGRA